MLLDYKEFKNIVFEKITNFKKNKNNLNLRKSIELNNNEYEIMFIGYDNNYVTENIINMLFSFSTIDKNIYVDDITGKITFLYNDSNKTFETIITYIKNLYKSDYKVLGLVMLFLDKTNNKCYLCDNMELSEIKPVFVRTGLYYKALEFQFNWCYTRGYDD